MEYGKLAPHFTKTRILLQFHWTSFKWAVKKSTDKAVNECGQECKSFDHCRADTSSVANGALASARLFFSITSSGPNCCWVPKSHYLCSYCLSFSFRHSISQWMVIIYRLLVYWRTSYIEATLHNPFTAAVFIILLTFLSIFRLVSLSPSTLSAITELQDH